MDTATGTVTFATPGLLVFDLDGTLIDSRRDLVACVNATLMHCGLSPLDDATVAGYVGDGASLLVQRALRAAAEREIVDARALPYFLQYYSEHLLDHTHLYPGVLKALIALRDRAEPAQMAVLTNKPVRPSERLCEALGLAPFFFAIYGGNTFATKKPDPQGLVHLWREAAARRGGDLSADQVVMIGDSQIDVQTARGAGVRSLGCTWGFAPAAMRAEQPDMLADNAAEWPGLLLGGI